MLWSVDWGSHGMYMCVLYIPSPWFPVLWLLFAADGVWGVLVGGNIYIWFLMQSWAEGVGVAGDLAGTYRVGCDMALVLVVVDCRWSKTSVVNHHLPFVLLLATR